MKYVCKRCGHKSDRLSNLKTHLKSKKGCDDILGCGLTMMDLFGELPDRNEGRDIGMYSCKKCGLKYKTLSGRNKHEGSCNVHEEVNSLRAEVLKLKAENDQLRSHPSTVNNINTTNIVDNSININNLTVLMNDFGNEDITHVIDDKPFLDKCLREISTAIRNVVEKIYYDAEHPENKTIMMKSRKGNQVMVRENDEWKLRHTSETLPKMVKKGRMILTNHYVTKDENGKCLNDEVDMKLVYLNDVVLPTTIAHKNNISMVKSLVGNYPYDTKI